MLFRSGCRNYENFLQLNEETWFDFLNRVCQYHINVPRIDLAIDDRKPYLSIPDLIVRTKEGLLSSKLREIDFHDSGELKEEVFQSKGGSLYLGSSASNLRLHTALGGSAGAFAAADWAQRCREPLFCCLPCAMVSLRSIRYA